MGLKETLQELFEKIKSNVIYECDRCDYEDKRARFEKDNGELECPQCGSTSIRVD